ncbi:hypothetical protein C446_13204 [Halobiforma nitratireducens JCM 10879]|uniref:Uncharacterized protein n=1 Tax=Halobiforma nitratireducens JCM 10879 TaxID=1227454 RepID=M0LNI4_9EURY|nr:hypothetical protein C446_13204 [Halobiforma nitratireducens JCM 10879]
MGALAAVAGCLGDGFDEESDPDGGEPDEDEPGNGTGDDDENGNGNGDDEEGSDGDEDEDEDVDKDVDEDDLQSGDGNGFSYEALGYQFPDYPDSPEASLLRDEDDADDWLEDGHDAGGGNTSDLAEFLDETSFDESVVVPLEARGSDLCHEMVLREVDLEDETLSVEAKVSDGRDDDGFEACAEQVTGVGRLVRVTFEDDPVTELSATIVDQDGQEHGISTASDDNDDS